MITSQIVEFTTSVCHIGRFSRLGIPIRNSEVPDKLVEKREGEEEKHEKLQSVMCFT